MSKVILLLIISTTLTVTASELYSQKAKVSLNMEEVMLSEVIEVIKTQTEFEFAYDIDLESLYVNKVTINVKRENIIKVLEQVLSNTNISYRIVDKIILLSRKQPSGVTEVTQGVTFEKIEIKGTVIDESTGEPLPGVNILISGTLTGTITDADGQFTIQVPDTNSTLIFSYIGYLTEKVIVAGHSMIDVKLSPDITKLEEVVVIGYGTQQKKDLTGSISVINTREIGSMPVSGIGEAMQGRAAGVQVITSGVPGSDPSFNIRGIGTINSSSPLYVIDGVPVSGGLYQLNVDDIASIQILKDASATAIYGSRGANGVIIITTKRGNIGDQNRLNFNYYYGIQQTAKMIDMLNASQFAELHNEMMENAGLTKNPNYSSPASLGIGTDWLDALFRTAPMQNYSLSYSGNSDKINYYVSGNVLDQKGIIVDVGFTRYTIQFNSDAKLSDRIKFGNSLTLEHDIRKSGDYNIQNTMLALPTQPIYRDDGTFSGPIKQPIWDGSLVNPIGFAKTVDNTRKRYNLLGSVYGEIEIIKDLKFKTTLGLQANLWNDRNWSPAYEWDSSLDETASLTQRSSNNITWLWDNTLTFDRVFNSIHHVTLLAGTSAQENRYEFIGGSVQDFQSDDTQQLVNGVEILTLTGNTTEWSLLSYMGRINYSYADKYLITATIRRDGSSRFGEGNKWGWFPSGSVAWRISNEEFLKGLTFINDLKVRAGYGIAGNQEIDNYSFASVLNTVQYCFNNNTVSAVVPNVMPNPNVQWEQQEQTDLGLDASFFNSRINLIIDGYIKNTDKMLVPMSVPVTSGYSDTQVAYANAGKIQNKGIEVTIATKNHTGAFVWNTNFNFSFNKNRVISLNDTVPLSTGSISLNYNLALIQASHPINSFYGFVTDGILQTQEEVDNHAVQVAGSDPYNRTSPGDIRFKDIRTDGVIDDNDRTFIGNPNPKFIFALNNTFAYKGFDLSIFLQGIYGNEILNANRIWSEAMAVAQNQTTETLNRWRGEGTSNSMPRTIYNDPNQNTRPSDRFVEDGSYLRIKNVVLGYTLPQAIVRKVHIANARIYISGQNLFTFTKYSGFDPEIGPTNVSSDLYSIGPANINSNLINSNLYSDIRTYGIDNNVYPVTRTISFGINLGF